MNFDLNNYEDHILDFLEGELSEQEIAAYQNWKAANPHLQAEEDLLRQTFLRPEAMTYSNKAALKSFGKTDGSSMTTKIETPATTKVIPLYRRFWSMGIVAAAILGFFFWTNLAETNITPGSVPVVEVPANTPDQNAAAQEPATEPIETIQDEVNDQPVAKEQGMLANLNTITEKAKELIANNDKVATPKKQQPKKSINTKRPTRFTKEDINLDRRFNSTIAESSKPRITSSPAPVKPVIEEQEEIAQVAKQVLDFNNNTEQQLENSEESTDALVEEIMEDIIVAEADPVEAQSVEVNQETEKQPADQTEDLADTQVAEPAFENEKIISGWQRVRKSIQNEDSVLGYAAREIADFVTPTILEGEDNREKKTIKVDVKIARTDLGKTIKRLRNK